MLSTAAGILCIEDSGFHVKNSGSWMLHGGTPEFLYGDSGIEDKDLSMCNVTLATAQIFCM